MNAFVLIHALHSALEDQVWVSPEKCGKVFSNWCTLPRSEIICSLSLTRFIRGWIVIDFDDPKAIYEHAAEWAEFLDWETTPVLTDEETGLICGKIYS